MNRNQKNGIIRIVAVLLSLLLMISTLAGAESSGKTGNAVVSSNLIITAPCADNESGISNVEQVEMEGYMSKKFVTDDVDTLNDNNYQMAVVVFASDYMAETKDDENQFPVSFENGILKIRVGVVHNAVNEMVAAMGPEIILQNGDFPFYLQNRIPDRLGVAVFAREFFLGQVLVRNVAEKSSPVVFGLHDENAVAADNQMIQLRSPAVYFQLKIGNDSISVRKAGQ